MASSSRVARGVRVPQQARSRRTRQRIVQAAVHCFETHGYDETTTAAIARQAGIAVGSVYDYFRDKRAILREILHDTVEELADLVVQGLSPEAWRGAEPREGGPLGLAPRASVAAEVLVLAGLAAALERESGFTREDYNLRHPGGALGVLSGPGGKPDQSKR